MKKNIFVSAIMMFVIGLSYLNTEAASEVTFPSDWKKWTAVSTTLTGIGALPGCDADGCRVDVFKYFPTLFRGFGTVFY